MLAQISSAAIDGSLNSVVQFTPQARRNFLQYLAKLSKVESDIIADLSNQSDDELLETRAKAELLGKTQWRIEAACDAEIWNRAERQTGGRGKKDDLEIGINKLVDRRAKQIGCTPMTVRNNRRVYELMQSVQQIEETSKSEFNSLATLPDKGYFQAALKAVDPVAAVQAFTQEKIKDPTFRVSDSERYLVKQRMLNKDAISTATEKARRESGVLSEREALIAHLKRVKKIITDTIIPDCPDRKFASRVYETDGLLGEVEDALESMSITDAQEAMRRAWDLGYHSERDMSEHTLFPVSIVSETMRKLFTQGEFIKVQRGGEHDSAPGLRSQMWHKVGEPLGDQYRNGYSITSDEDDDDGDDF